ncbi:bestrophin-like domain [Roseiarcus sp.]|uniref:bestrophin-like domain n=1 Tax=Roseiarcus sp. TaxID=1969460 RepID=UPI003F9B3DDB
MHPLARSITVALITFGASLLGMLIQLGVSLEVLTASKGAVGGMVGLVSLLLALVLGLLVFTAFSIFTTQQSEAYSLGPVVADIDLALDQYGPEGASGRAGLRASLQRTRVRFFGDAERGPQPFTFDEMKATFAGLDGYFDSLEPATDRQRRLVTKAWDLARKYHDTQMTMARQLASPFPPHVLTVVICWATVLFLGNGVVAAPNAVTIIAHLAGAISIGTAIFLILELSNPYTGFIRISPAGVDNALSVLGEVSSPAPDGPVQSERARTPA